MTDTMLWLYLLLQLDSIKSFVDGLQLFFVILLVCFTSVMLFVAAIDEGIERVRPYFKYLIGLLTAAMFFSFVNMTLPTTERAALIVVGAKVIDSNTTSILTNIPEKYAKILEAKAQKYMDETLKDKQ